MKKVAIIIERIDTSLGGAERSIFELTDALSHLGLEVDILAAKGQVDNKNIHILCQDMPGKRTGYFVFKKALRSYLSKNRYDIIHSVLPYDFIDIYQPRGGSYAESILRNAASYQNKFIESCKKLTAFTNLRRTILHRAERKLFKNPDGPVIAALSQYVAEQFKRHYAVGSERIMVIPNGVNIDRQINPQDAEKLRAQILSQLKLKETDNPVLFLFVANNFRLKGLAVLIRAMQLVSQRKTQQAASLIVAGNDRIDKYHRLAEKLGIINSIIFSGYIRDIQNILSIINVAILPTFYDPSSRFVLEALAAGKPVITTRFNGAADLFVHNRHGIVLDAPEDIVSLAEAIIYFSNMYNISKASAAIAADNLKEKISIRSVAVQLKTVYESISKRKQQK